jgi:hypothetical protein
MMEIGRHADGNRTVGLYIPVVPTKVGISEIRSTGMTGRSNRRASLTDKSWSRLRPAHT